MFKNIFFDIQQNIKLFLFIPIICAIFRAVFIFKFNPYSTLRGKWKKIYHCFRYGFWWGMDINAYVFIIPFLFITLPGAFLPGWLVIGDRLRIIGISAYLVVLYSAFMGKLIFYQQYHDIYNRTLWLGKNADKRNLIAVFFHQYHGMEILLGCILFMTICLWIVKKLLAVPDFEYPIFSFIAMQYLFNSTLLILSITGYYYFRYGGSISRSNKPKWDRMPDIVKQDIFFARATADDLITLKKVYYHPLNELFLHTDEQVSISIDRVMSMTPEISKEVDWRALQSPIEAFKKAAKGARIKKPSHIFLIVGESYSQVSFDSIYNVLNVVEAGKKFRKNAHTVTLNNFLPAGMMSRPAIVSLMSGIYDARLELNEREPFWQGTVPTSLPVQLRKLGYESTYWYGGSVLYGSFDRYAAATGFGMVKSAVEFCGSLAPKTELGVYDNVFLEKAAEQIKAMPTDKLYFHYLYTTSNHGPYQIPLKKMGFDTEKIMPDAPTRVKENRKVQKKLGTLWYSDQAINKFIMDMLAAYPDSLIILTGDHASNPIPFDGSLINRREPTIREQLCTEFSMYHRDIDQSILAGNTIGGHMNIMPTILELIAPPKFVYYSLFPSLLESIDHVVTPYHWMTRNNIGLYENDFYQSLAVTGDEVATLLQHKCPFLEEMEGLCDITDWLVRYPKLLERAAVLADK